MGVVRHPLQKIKLTLKCPVPLPARREDAAIGSRTIRQPLMILSMVVSVVAHRQGMLGRRRRVRIVRNDGLLERLHVAPLPRGRLLRDGQPGDIQRPVLLLLDEHEPKVDGDGAEAPQHGGDDNGPGRLGVLQVDVAEGDSEDHGGAQGEGGGDEGEEVGYDLGAPFC